MQQQEQQEQQGRDIIEPHGKKKQLDQDTERSAQVQAFAHRLLAKGCLGHTRTHAEIVLRLVSLVSLVRVRGDRCVRLVPSKQIVGILTLLRRLDRDLGREAV